MRTPIIVMIACLVVSACGCDNGGTGTSPRVEKIKGLTREKAELETSLESARSENQELRKQVDVLSALPEGVKGPNVYKIEKIKVTGYTNLYDKDRDGKKESLIVYLKAFDDRGDVVKAPGSVVIQLWDLNKDSESALVGEWQVGPEELKGLWFSTLITSNYRFVYDVSGKVADATEPLTVKVEFTDLLTGKVFKEQLVIEP